MPLPSKWLLEFGEPIRTDEFDAGAAEDPMLVFNVTDEVRETIQSTLYSLLMQRQSVLPLDPVSGLLALLPAPMRPFSRPVHALDARRSRPRCPCR